MSAISDKIVDGVAQLVHHSKGADDGHGQRKAGNHGGRKIAQEQENDQHDQRDGEE